MIYRRRPNELDLSGRRRVLDAMGRCRKVLINEGDRARPFGPGFLAIYLVATGIDRLAEYLTGNPDYYAIGGSTGSDEGRWRDQGT